MKYFKYALCMIMGASIAILVETYDKEIRCACDKMIKKEQKMLKNGLEME